MTIPSPHMHVLQNAVWSRVLYGAGACIIAAGLIMADPEEQKPRNDGAVSLGVLPCFPTDPKPSSAAAPLFSSAIEFRSPSTSTASRYDYAHTMEQALFWNGPRIVGPTPVVQFERLIHLQMCGSPRT